ncbi:N-acetylmuramoyl-L-alanine amidase [Trujillonella humicola]|uniref:N-acetylmuramoyl-L-alanine amidase n=1 Tax=Trujillonella humicola TaxID=3383699 RepID=UPI003905C54F
MRRAGAGAVLVGLLLAGCGGAPADAGSPASSSPSASSVPASAPRLPPVAGTVPPATTAPPSPSLVPPAPVPAPVVVLDPGHNGGNAAAPGVVGAPVPDGAGGTKACNTTGTATDAGYPEHAFTWDVALRTRDLLSAAGVEVVLTRADDTGVGPCVDARGALPGRVGAAAFVGIHGDGAAAAGRGFHVITSSLDAAGPQVAAGTDALALALRDALLPVVPPAMYAGAGGLDDRPDLAALNLATTPAVYVECGNMRNPADAALMSDPAGRQALAEALAAGVLTFLGR